jgi:predicted enzyme related to lactoylglutathione lyase
MEKTAYETGVPCWADLITGWTDEPKPMGAVTYHEIQNNAHTVAGCMPAEGDRRPADVASGWVVYFLADESDATAAKATELSGILHETPADNPFGRVAMLGDPTGETFSVTTMASS